VSWGGSGAFAMPEKPSSSKSWTRLAGIGFELAAAIGGFTLVGYWWDRHFGTAPWGVLVGALLGLVGGMYNLIRQSLIATRDAGREGQARNGDGEP
jgi:F0F1-type ATP synthase assembly protein I